MTCRQFVAGVTTRFSLLRKRMRAGNFERNTLVVTVRMRT